MKKKFQYTLEDWLQYAIEEKINVASDVSSRHNFPTNELLQEYLASINLRSIAEVKSLLRTFLIQSGEFGFDTINREFLLTTDDLSERIEHSEYVRRLISPTSFAWEGITWVLDLLPNFPSEAISVIEAYDIAHYYEIPDGRIMSLMDSIAVIRAKFLNCVDGYELLGSITPREFEYLTASLFLKDGISVSVTAQSRDGGYDIMLVRDTETQLKRTLIECKQLCRKVDVDVVRRLNGVLSENKASTGKIVTNSTFTIPAKKFARESARIELIDGTELCKRLNSRYGTYWFRSFSRILRSAKSILDNENAIINNH